MRRASITAMAVTVAVSLVASAVADAAGKPRHKRSFTAGTFTR
jgi:hypothetical protein